MKPLKKVLLTGALTAVVLATTAITSEATTVKVTGETVNIRKGPSTDESVVAMLSEGVECELLGEKGDWYQIKYKNYTGYISKQYSQKIGETSSNNQTSNSNTQTNQTTSNNQTNGQDQNNQASQNTQTNQNNSNNQNNTVNQDNSNTQNNTTNQANNNQTSQTNQNNNNNQNANNQASEQGPTYKKLTQNTEVKILPLIHASKIGEMKKNAQVILLSQTTLWSYIQSDTISGWVRNDYLTAGKAPNSTTTSSSSGSTTSNSTERTAYISEEGVNFRKSASTSSAIIRVLKLNAQVTIIGEEGSWYKIKSGNDTGYVSKDFVSNSQKVTSRSSTTREEEPEKENNSEEQKNNTTKTDGKDNTNDVKVTTTSNQASTTTSKNTNATQSTNNASSSTQSTNNASNSNKNTTNNIKGTDIVAYAKQYLGCKYVYGGDGSNKTFDCSGFTMYVYKHFGISLPHGATSQYKSGKGTKISKLSDLQAGDIVFLTDYETGVGIGHCGIYIGDGNFIDASTVTYTVTISSFKTMFKDRFYAGLRLI